jgi:hypothetical protein
MMDNAQTGGACIESGRTWETRKAVRGESRREQQFYRYSSDHSLRRILFRGP